MSGLKILCIVLIVCGALSLSYNTFSYTKEEHKASIGSLDISVKDKEHVVIPNWVGISAIIIGTGMLLVPGKKI